MNTRPAQESKPKSLIFDYLSIQQLLPLLILFLLLTVVAAFTAVSYYEVKKTSLEIGTERVTTLADKLAAIFQHSIDNFASSASSVATDKDVIAYFNTGTIEDSTKTVNYLSSIGKKDTSNKSIQLLNVNRKPVLSWRSGDFALTPNIDITNSPSPGKSGYVSVGKIAQVRGLMYFPVLAYVRNRQKLIGYVVEWKILRATQESIDQLGQLLGASGKVYFGNDDNRFWTNLLKPIAKPPVDFKLLQHTAQYSRDDTEPLIGALRPLNNSRWLVLVELSSASMFKAANTFLHIVTIIGIVLILIGAGGGWLLSRTITKPLQELSNAASLIAEGQYGLAVEYKRKNELGKLAQSFNVMAARIRLSQQYLEQRVEDKTKELEAAQTDIKYQEENDKKKDEFISVASHELKTPLTTIKAFFQIAEKEITSEFRSFSLIPKASRQVKRMEHLISDLLDVSKINLRKIQYRHDLFDIGQVVKEAVHNIQETSPNHQLIFTGLAPAAIYGDANRIEQVVTNLLDNAVKFSPDGRTVLISSESVDGGVTINITDFGIGIPDDTISELFRRFYRANTSHNFQGLGLGLFISSEIVREHGGTITVRSEVGKGSTFTIKLPLARYN